MLRNYRRVGGARTPTIVSLSSGVTQVISGGGTDSGILKEPRFIANEKIDANVTVNKYSNTFYSYEVE